MTPFFSIIIPTYNRARRLDRAIATILAQAFSDWELIVIDDGSEDDTSTVVQRHSDPRIRYFYKQNEERSIARNLGIKVALGKYVSFLDSDDLLLPHHLTVARDLIRIHPDRGVVHLGFALFEEASGTITPCPLPPEAQVLRALSWGNPLCGNAIFVKREHIQEVTFPPSQDAMIGEDWVTWLRLIARHGIKLTASVTCYVVAHRDRSTAKIDPERFRRAAEVFLNTLRDDETFQRIVGPRAYRHICAYQLLAVALHFLINDTVSPGAALRYMRAAIRTDFRVLFTKRMAVCVRKLLLPRPCPDAALSE